MFYDVSLWWILPGLFLAMCATCLFGQYLNRWLRSRRNADEDTAGLDGFVVSGVFGLMALLMGFSFSLAIGRYEERRQDVVNEANAISTMYSRLALLAPAERVPLEADIREYTKIRVTWGSTSGLAAQERLSDQADAVCDRFAARLFAILAAGPKDSRLPTLVGAYNDMSDIAATRHAVRNAHLPGGVTFLLAVFLFGSAGVLGFTIHARGARSMVGSAMVIALLALAYCAILDLDRPARGTFQVPQDEMIRLSHKLGN
ncbi:MAG: hypothetical protein JSR96_00565 [Proteobacteria bacterium]|nr:hypothetical protein [Pseudomonadota bacterium]